MSSWTTHHAPGNRHGEMVCTACRKPIVEGDYRVRETLDAYLPQHRACSEQWPGWQALDGRRKQQQRAAKGRAIQDLLAEAAERGVTHDELRGALGVPGTYKDVTEGGNG